MESKKPKESALTCKERIKIQKRKQKALQWKLGGYCFRSSCELCVFENEGEGVWVKKTPPPLFNHFRARGARPGELTCIFFFGKTQVCSLRVGVRLLEPP